MTEKGDLFYGVTECVFDSWNDYFLSIHSSLHSSYFVNWYGLLCVSRILALKDGVEDTTDALPCHIHLPVCL